MLWMTYAFLAGVMAGFGVVGVTLLRRRMRRRLHGMSQDHAGLAYGEAGTLHGLTPRERTGFLRMAREHTRTQRERWGRDYSSMSASAVPGRLPGLPRVLRIRD